MHLQIEYVPKEQLIPYANNAKLHTSEQVEQIKESIRQWDFNDPIAIWGGYEVVEGHGRLLAAMEMDEIQEVPIIRLDHLTDEERKAYALVHNKLTMNTDFNADLLAQELSDIVNQDMTIFGFDLSKIEIEDIDTDFDAEEPIARELNEANNYIVLEFNTETDWEDAQIVFGLEKVQTADANKNIRRHGIGRVIDGAEVMERIRGHED